MSAPHRTPAGAAPVDVRCGDESAAGSAATPRRGRPAPPARPRRDPALSSRATAPGDPAAASGQPEALERSWEDSPNAARRGSLRVVAPSAGPPSPARRGRPHDTAVAAAVLVGLVVALVGSGAALALLPAEPADARALALGELPVAVNPVATTADVDAEAPPPRRLVVERLGVDEPLIGLRVLRDGTLETPDDPDDVGWHRAGTAPGDNGPAVLVGHVDSYEGAAVFFRLRELQPGDRAAVTRVDGSVVEFEVYGLETVPKEGFPTDRVYGATPGPELRLVTCGGAFDRATRSYTENVVAYLRAVPDEAGA